MKQVWITKYGAPETLEIRSADPAAPGEGEVTVSVKAAGINFADIMARKGLYPDAPKLPFVVGYEIAGVVERAGPGVAPSFVGKDVVALTRFGGYADTINLPAESLFEKPGNLSFEEAAALPVNYITAYQLIVIMGSLRGGTTVLIHNAGGGVGLASLQIAKHLGAVTIGTASASKHQFLKEQGLDHAVDYRVKDWDRTVRDLTGGRGVDLILDPIGGAYWKKNLRLLRPTGRLGCFGVSSVAESRAGRLPAMLSLLARLPFLNVLSLMNGNKGVFGVNVGHLWKEGDRIRGWVKEILSGVAEGWVKPHVDRSFSFEEAAAAHRYIEERRNRGKVVLVP